MLGLEERMDREELLGTRMMAREAQLPSSHWKERIYSNVAAGIASADSVGDRAIPLFSPGLRYELTSLPAPSPPGTGRYCKRYPPDA